MSHQAVAPSGAMKQFIGSPFTRGLSGILLALLLWQLWSAVFPSRSVPSAVETLAVFLGDLGNPRLWAAITESLAAFAIGVGLAILVAIPLGVLIGGNTWVRRATVLQIEILRPIPTVALLPLLILLFGTGVRMAAVLACVTAVWPLLIQTIYGMADIDPVAKDTGRAYHLSRLQHYRYIVIPSISPYVATGMRISVIAGLVVAVASSLIAGSSGLGYLISSATASGVPALTYSRTIMAGLLGFVVMVLFSQIERRVLKWHPSFRKASS